MRKAVATINKLDPKDYFADGHNFIVLPWAKESYGWFSTNEAFFDTLEQVEEWIQNIWPDAEIVEFRTDEMLIIY